MLWEQGASSAWWNYRHYLHHSKPNIPENDPDVNMPYVFMLGNELAAAWAKKQRHVPSSHLSPCFASSVLFAAQSANQWRKEGGERWMGQAVDLL